mmetsp:Transcript_29066/g.65887  ORF Transcript_29066/g.65887 Transcript_29066/m.65887 type:complete len:203 (+) Transcript_29066:229-837(+)
MSSGRHRRACNGRWCRACHWHLGCDGLREEPMGLVGGVEPVGQEHLLHLRPLHATCDEAVQFGHLPHVPNIHAPRLARRAEVRQHLSKLRVEPMSTLVDLSDARHLQRRHSRSEGQVGDQEVATPQSMKAVKEAAEIRDHLGGLLAEAPQTVLQPEVVLRERIVALLSTNEVVTPGVQDDHRVRPRRLLRPKLCLCRLQLRK